MTTEQTEYMNQFTTKLRTLRAELTSIQERAFPIVEELDNWELENKFKFSWSPETKKMFGAMRNLITRV